MFIAVTCCVKPSNGIATSGAFSSGVNLAPRLLISAMLSSLPVRVFARSIAERAKDARFRFLAWTVGAIPLPPAWRTARHVQRLADLGARAHGHSATGSVPDTLRLEIDAAAAELYGLSTADSAALRDFDHWLSGSAQSSFAQVTA